MSNKIDDYITQCFIENNLPGLAVAVINEDNNIYIKCLGFGDIGNDIEIDETSLDVNSLRKTVDDVSNAALVSNPGSQFLYATVNYDVLGRIIEVISGLSFES